MEKTNDDSLNYLEYLKSGIIDIDDYALLFTIKKDSCSSLEENKELEDEYFSSINRFSNKERLIFVLELAHKRIINEFNNFSFEYKMRNGNKFSEVIGFIANAYIKITQMNEEDLLNSDLLESYKHKISLRLFEYGPKNYTGFSSIYHKYYNEFIGILDQKLADQKFHERIY